MKEIPSTFLICPIFRTHTTAVASFLTGKLPVLFPWGSSPPSVFKRILQGTGALLLQKNATPPPPHLTWTFVFNLKKRKLKINGREVGE